MKTKQIFAGLILSTLCFLAPAQAQVEQVATDSGKEVLQGETSDNGVATITQAGKVFTVSTKDLLANLALDETQAGKWFTNPKYNDKVPANAKLEIIYAGRGDFSSISYRVVSGTNVVDVSNVLSGSAAATGTNVISQALVDTNGFEEGPFSYTIYQEFTINYDARPIGGHLWFQVTGLAACSTTAGKTNPRNGKFLETDSFSLTDGTGAGGDTAGTQFIISGVSVHASGSTEQEPLRFATAPGGGYPTGVVYVISPGEEWSDGADNEEVNAFVPPALVGLPVGVTSTN